MFVENYTWNYPKTDSIFYVRLHLRKRLSSKLLGHNIMGPRIFYCIRLKYYSKKNGFSLRLEWSIQFWCYAEKDKWCIKRACCRVNFVPTEPSITQPIRTALVPFQYPADQTSHFSFELKLTYFLLASVIILLCPKHFKWREARRTCGLKLPLQRFQFLSLWRQTELTLNTTKTRAFIFRP
jgi:hypothetical protein